MRLRPALFLLALAVVAAPLVAEAQQAGRQGLREAGYVEGQSIIISTAWRGVWRTSLMLQPS